MPSIEAHVATDRAGRYLAQLCKHAAAMGSGRGHGMHRGHAPQRREVTVRADWSETHGVLTFTPWGVCTLAATSDRLSLRIDAADESGLHQIQDVLTRDIDRIGRRDGLVIDWHACAG